MPADGRFAEQAGTVVDAAADVLVIAPGDREEELTTRLARIGFDRIAGWLRDPEAAMASVPELMEPSSRVTVEQLRQALAGDNPPVVLDVRNTGEREEGHLPGSAHIPLAELPRRLAEVPTDRPVVVHCAGGHRSSIAASLLRNRGLSDVSDLLGGYGAWLAANETVNA